MIPNRAVVVEAVVVLVLVVGVSVAGVSVAGGGRDVGVGGGEGVVAVGRSWRRWVSYS